MGISQELLQKVKLSVSNIDAIKAAEQAFQGSLTVIDIREQSELSGGTVKDAIHIPRGFLELKIESIAPSQSERLAIYCAGGTRSLLAAKALQDMGYQNVVSIEGGFKAWKDAGLPIDYPKTLTQDFEERYARHLTLQDIGETGQLTLSQSKVLVIGAGGLGSPVLSYLAAAGVGTIGIFDHDTIDRSNLQRQTIHRDYEVGYAKVLSAERFIRELNPNVKVVSYQQRLSEQHASIVQEYDAVVDCTDNFATRFLISKMCSDSGTPHVHGAVFRFEGECAVFSESEETACYRCLHRDEPSKEESPSCSEAGVLGVLPGIIGSIQALETIKLLLGLPRGNQTLNLFDGKSLRWTKIQLNKDPDCPNCGSKKL
ncbi:MAG: molybdopterin-synthase adenylyltransferase MoeB [Pseudobacteriovorax sp.]|nr:molybdopterin-synthase adenylyltransferase MoeB [Pseudobacteriovorax sp.]